MTSSQSLNLTPAGPRAIVNEVEHEHRLDIFTVHRHYANTTECSPPFSFNRSTTWYYYKFYDNAVGSDPSMLNNLISNCKLESVMVCIIKSKAYETIKRVHSCPCPLGCIDVSTCSFISSDTSLVGGELRQRSSIPDALRFAGTLTNDTRRAARVLSQSSACSSESLGSIIGLLSVAMEGEEDDVLPKEASTGDSGGKKLELDISPGGTSRDGVSKGEFG